MSAFSNNSIAWANLQITGGVRRILLITGLVAVVLPLMMFGTTRISLQPDSTLAGWFVAMSIAQGIMFGIVIPSRVHAAIKRDRLTNLIESHRLMPESSSAAVLGYIFGPNLLLLSVMGAVMVIGLFIASTAHQDWTGWLALNAAAAGVSMMLCCIVAFMSQWLPKFPPALIGVLAGPVAFNAGAIIPALRVMFSPYREGFSSLQSGEIQIMHLAAFASQLMFASILFIGACRRYRRDDLVPLGFGWSFALLALWVALTCIGTKGDRVGILGGLFNTDQMIGIAYVISVSLAMLFSAGPISSAALGFSRWTQRRAIDAYHIDKRPISLPVATVIVLVLLLTLLSAAPLEVGVLTGYQSTVHFREPMHLILTGVVIGLFVLTVALLAHAANRIKVPSAWLILPYLGIFWVLLPMIDGVTAALQGHIEVFPRSLSSASAPFSLGMIWKNQLGMAMTGVIAQAAIIPMLIALWTGVKRMNRRRGAGEELVVANAT